MILEGYKKCAISHNFSALSIKLCKIAFLFLYKIKYISLQANSLIYSFFFKFSKNLYNNLS